MKLFVILFKIILYYFEVILWIYCRTALGMASYFGHESIVAFLLNNDADVNRPDNNGEY